MHFHLPKPLHGWRAFAGEVGIIVLGVLIALAAQQAVESWQWRSKVAVVRRSLIGELANDRARWDRDVAAARCALGDADRIDAWMHDGANGPAPNVPSLRSGNLLSMHSANWSLAAGSEALEHFPLEEQLQFAALYDGIAHRQTTIDSASNLIDRTRTLAPLAVDSQGRRELSEALGALRAQLNSLLDNVSYMESHFDAVGVESDQSDFARELPTTGCAETARGAA